MVNNLERRVPLSGLRSVVYPTGEVAGVTTLSPYRSSCKRPGASG